MTRIFKLSIFCVVLVLLLSVSECRRSIGGGGRRTSSWGNSGRSKPKPSTNTGFSHGTHDASSLSYGNHEPSGVRRQQPSAPKPSNTNHQPSAPKPSNTNHQPSAPRHEEVNKNVGWNTNAQPNPNTQNTGNIGWNVGQNQPGHVQPGQPGWNVNRPGQNTPNQQTHVNNVHNAPPPYPGGPPGAPPGYPVHGQAPPGYPGHGQAPPPYPGYNSHGQNMGPPPAYPGYPSHNGPPPAYPGYPSHGAPPGYSGGYHPQQPGYGGGYGGGYQQPGGYGGYNQGGYGGFGGGLPGGLPGGFGGGGFGGYGSSNRGGSGFSASNMITGALLGYTLSNMLRDNSNHHYYYPNSHTVYSDGNNANNAPGSGNTLNVAHNVTGDQGSYASYVGNMTCISIYNAREVNRWANSTLQDFYSAYPKTPFPMAPNGTNDGLNFTITPGEIIHNETLAVTCCGTDKGQVNLVDLTNGNVKDVNCIYQTFQMPFRKMIFTPVNITSMNTTNSNITMNTTSSNSTTTSETPTTIMPSTTTNSITALNATVNTTPEAMLADSPVSTNSTTLNVTTTQPETTVANIEQTTTPKS